MLMVVYYMIYENNQFDIYIVCSKNKLYWDELWFYIWYASCKSNEFWSNLLSN